MPAVASRAPRSSVPRSNLKAGPKPEPKILFQSYFKSVGPRTYAAQMKEAANGNHFLVLTEGKRDESSGDVKKTRLFVFSEDFVAFFRLMKETSEFIKAHPLSEKVKQKREKFWAKHNSPATASGPARRTLPAKVD